MQKEFDFDKLLGELVYEEFSDGKNYFINVDGHTICVENYEIIEREKFKIHKWDIDNPVSLWTNLVSMELYYVDNDCFELHMMFTNGDRLENKIRWYFTLKGANIKYV